jgi:hypothetical protein
MTDYHVFIKHTYYTRATITAATQQQAEYLAEDLFEKCELHGSREIHEMADCEIDSVESVNVLAYSK